jgi:hypothetical protein
MFRQQTYLEVDGDQIKKHCKIKEKQKVFCFGYRLLGHSVVAYVYVCVCVCVWEIATKVCSRKLKGRDHLEDLGVDGKITLEWVLEK